MHKRQTIYKEDNIRTLLGVFNESPLISNGKVILSRIFEVDEIDEGGAFLAIIKVFDWHTVLQIVHQYRISCRRVPVSKLLEFIDRLIQSLKRKSLIDALQRGQ